MAPILSELARAARELARSGLVTGAGGNVSAREEDRMWISPSGLSLEDAAEEDYPSVSIESGEILGGHQRPSSEVLMHLAIYRVRPNVTAIFHAHPQGTIALCSSGHDLRPMFADYHVYLGHNVPHVPYVTVTTPELAQVVGLHFAARDCRGMVLRNHGTITVGASVKEAAFRTYAMEEQALVQLQALQVGEPTFLSDVECEELDALDSEEYRRQILAEMRPAPEGGG